MQIEALDFSADTLPESTEDSSCSDAAEETALAPEGEIDVPVSPSVDFGEDMIEAPPERPPSAPQSAEATYKEARRRAQTPATDPDPQPAVTVEWDEPETLLADRQPLVATMEPDGTFRTVMDDKEPPEPTKENANADFVPTPGAAAPPEESSTSELAAGGDGQPPRTPELPSTGGNDDDGDNESEKGSSDTGGDQVGEGKTLHGSLIVQREANYDRLFKGELPGGQVEEGDLSVTALCRATRKGGGRPTALAEHIERIPSVVDAILTEQDAAARQDGGDAIFGFVSKEARDQIGGIVADILVQWEVAYDKAKVAASEGADKRLIVDADSPNRGLVIETAAAVMEAITPENGFDLGKTKGDRATAVKLISCWGPEFVRQWSNGKIMEQWADDRQLTPEEKAEMFAIFPPGVRKQFATDYPGDPLAALDLVHHNLKEIWTTERMAIRLGWSENEVDEVFTPALRKTLIKGYLHNPNKAIDTVKYNLEEVLTDDNIARHIGWSPEEVAESFAPGIRKKFAAGNLADPLKAIRKIRHNFEEVLTDANLAQRLNWSENEVVGVFNPKLRRYLAVANTADPLKGADRVKERFNEEGNIAQRLGWTIEKVRIVFNVNRRKELAHIANPSEFLDTIKHNLDEILAEERIVARLGWSKEKVAFVFTLPLRARFAVNNRADPLKAVDAVCLNFDEILTDANLAQRLNWSETKVTAIFTPEVRRYFAIRAINTDPLRLCQDWIEGNTTVTAWHDRRMREKLEEISE